MACLSKITVYIILQNECLFSTPRVVNCYLFLHRAGYEKPTCIQAQAIPAIMGGNDLIGIAKTGSGKTVAFLLPMLRHIMDQRPLDNGEGPIGKCTLGIICGKFYPNVFAAKRYF